MTEPYPPVSRREFLIASGAVAGGLTFTQPVASLSAAEEAAKPWAFKPVEIPAWVRKVTRMAFVTPGEIKKAAELGVQVCHGNAVWPYFPLRRDGGGLNEADAKLMKDIIGRSHKHGMKYCLGLPPFPSVSHMKAHPDWRVHPDDSDAATKIEPREDNLGTRLGCNNGPWGDYLIAQCVELMNDFNIDGYSFDGNYHAPICFCPACKDSYKTDTGKTIPPKANLDDIAYRQYLIWRGERLEQHYAKLQQRLKAANPDAVVMTWTVNAGRYGHLLHSPRAMSTRMNLLFDLPMQEWWLDETNFGASVAPAFGAAYQRAVTGYRPAACEAYLMSRGNPYGTDSFPRHERITRNLHAMTNGSTCAESFGWPGQYESTAAAFQVVKDREAWLTNTEPLAWAGLLVSEQTRQFYAYRDIADRWLPYLFGTFRTAMEEHLPLTLLNDWDVTSELRQPLRESLSGGRQSPGSSAEQRRKNSTQRQEPGGSRLPLGGTSGLKVLILAGAAALSDEQVAAIREFVRVGGGLVATGETSLCDELGRPRKDFALADLFGCSYRGRPAATTQREALDANFAITVDEQYWQQRVGAGRLTWDGSSIFDDPKLRALVPHRSATFKGPQVLVTEPRSNEVIARLIPDGWKDAPIPAVITRTYGSGRVAYLPACLDAAMWSYSYPYQRRMLTRLIEWGAGGRFPIEIEAPMCVQTTFWRQRLEEGGSRTVLHFFNGLNTTANHGLPVVDVPLREEAIPIHGIKVHLREHAFRHAFAEPGHVPVKLSNSPSGSVVELPPLEIHQMLVLD